LEIVEKIYNYGYDTREFYRSLMDQFRDLLVSLIQPESPTLEISEADRRELRRQAEMAGLERLQQSLNLLISREEDLRMSSHPRLVLETVLIRLGRMGELLSFEEILRKLQSLEKRLAEEKETSPGEARPASLSDAPAHYELKESEPVQEGTRGWDGFLDDLSSKNAPMANVLRNWQCVGLHPDRIELARGGNNFQATYLDDPERRRKLEEFCRSYFGRNLEIQVKNQMKHSMSPVPERAEKVERKGEDLPQPVQDILELFKGEIQAQPAGKEKNGGAPQNQRRKS
jgi:DNA polymerase III subunit gamma/tau